MNKLPLPSNRQRASAFLTDNTTNSTVEVKIEIDILGTYSPIPCVSDDRIVFNIKGEIHRLAASISQCGQTALVAVRRLVLN
jgi:mRNA-degrading endonuclease HigB of HigAB toxin-antitoxin module